mmetsp:Transcript_16199/g.42819  ORF Transcript_16199/g.42819 Transcript_16199/m.42819 type:complete len:314 (-) Transcript_16199:163-1104(-)
MSHGTWDLDGEDGAKLLTLQTDVATDLVVRDLVQKLLGADHVLQVQDLAGHDPRPQLLHLGDQAQLDHLLGLFDAQPLRAQLEAFEGGPRLLLRHQVAVLEEGHPDRLALLVLLHRVELELPEGDQKLADSVFRHKGGDVDEAQPVVDGRRSAALHAWKHELSGPPECAVLRHHLPKGWRAVAQRKRTSSSERLRAGVALRSADLELAVEELDAVEPEAVGGLLGRAELDEGEEAAAAHRCASDRLSGHRVDLDRLRHLVQELHQLGSSDAGRQVPDVQLPHALGVGRQRQGADGAHPAGQVEAALERRGHTA